MGRLGVGEIDEWTLRRVQRLQRVKYFSAHMRRKARADLAGTPELLALVVSDDERIDAVIAGAVPTNDELLLLVEFQLDPRAAPLSRVVLRISALCDYAFQAETLDDTDDLLCRTRELLRNAQSGSLHDTLELGTSLLERQACEIDAVQVQHVERVIHDRVPRVGSAVLKRLKGWMSFRVDSDNLAIEHHRIGVDPLRSRIDTRICAGKALVVARADLHVAPALENQRAIPVELDLVHPVRTLGHCLHERRGHGLDEPGRLAIPLLHVRRTLERHLSDRVSRCGAIGRTD